MTFSLCSQTNVGASCWKDNKPTTIMYTGFNPTDNVQVQRKKKDGSSVTYPCPAAMASYNCHMGGVDVGDQLRGYYCTTLKSRKFYKYISNFLQECSLTNAFVLYKASHSSSKMSLKKFREVVSVQLIGEYCSRRRPGREGFHVQPLPLRHFPKKVSGKKKGRCSLCRQHKHRKDSQWFCSDCGVWLCHPGTDDDCFLQWHTRILQFNSSTTLLTNLSQLFR